MGDARERIGAAKSVKSTVTAPLRLLSIAWLVESISWSIPWLFNLRHQLWGYVTRGSPVLWIASYHTVIALGGPLTVVLLWRGRALPGCILLISLASAWLLMELIVFQFDPLLWTLPTDLLSLLTLGVVGVYGARMASTGAD